MQKKVIYLPTEIVIKDREHHLIRREADSMTTISEQAQIAVSRMNGLLRQRHFDDVDVTYLSQHILTDLIYLAALGKNQATATENDTIQYADFILSRLNPTLIAASQLEDFLNDSNPGVRLLSLKLLHQQGEPLTWEYIHQHHADFNGLYLMIPVIDRLPLEQIPTLSRLAQANNLNAIQQLLDNLPTPQAVTEPAADGKTDSETIIEPSIPIAGRYPLGYQTDYQPSQDPLAMIRANQLADTDVLATTLAPPKNHQNSAFNHVEHSTKWATALDCFGTKGLARIFTLFSPFALTEGYQGSTHTRGLYTAAWLEHLDLWNFFLAARSINERQALTIQTDTLAARDDFETFFQGFEKQFGMFVYTQPERSPYERRSVWDEDNARPKPLEIAAEDQVPSNLVFDTYFYAKRYKDDNDWKPHNYGYDYRQMPNALHWLKQTLDQLSLDSDAYEGLKSRLEHFIQSQAFMDMEQLITQTQNPDILIDKVPNFLEKMASITRHHQSDIADLRDVIIHVSYLLTLANYTRQASATQTLPLLSIAQPAQHHEIDIYNGVDSGLYMVAEPKPITPNSVHFDENQRYVILSGTNAGGKTHLLQMVANNLLLAMKGNRALAESLVYPELSHIEFAINLSMHSQNASAYQNEITRILEIIEKLKVNGSPDKPQILIIDEPFRGTDQRDAIPLLVGLVQYCLTHNIYLMFSTHFNSIQDIITQIDPDLAAKGMINTMERETHKMVPGAGQSNGIAEAKNSGLHPDIIAMANAIDQQLESGQSVIQLNYTATMTPSTSQIRFLTDGGSLQEIGAYGDTDYRRDQVRYRQGPIAQALSGFYGVNLDDYYFEFIERLAKPLTQTERTQRITALETLSGYIPDGLKFYHNNPMKVFRYFSNQFKVYVINHPDEDYESNRVRNFNGHRQDNTPADILKQLPVIYDMLNDQGLTAENMPQDIRDALTTLHNFTLSETYQQINGYIQQHASLHDKAVDVADDTELKAWINFLIPHKESIHDLFAALKVVDFYLASAGAISYYHMSKVFPGQMGQIDFAAGRHVVHSGKKDYQPISTVQGNERLVDPDRLINPISGTNGGGKTTALETIGQIIFCAEQLGYTWTQDATIGAVSFMLTQLTTPEHEQENSSFQNEVKKIQELVKKYEDMGCPSGGVVLLDEPFKGTSEKSAIPLIIALCKYFEAHGVRVMFTTHFSGIYDVINKLDPDSTLSAQPLYVEYFDNPDEKYLLKNGIGQSNGVKVAETMGLPEEIIAVAKKVKAKIYP